MTTMTKMMMQIWMLMTVWKMVTSEMFCTWCPCLDGWKRYEQPWCGRDI